MILPRAIKQTFALLTLLALTGGAASARLVRLSEWLTNDQIEQAGCGKLSPDQIAAIDALASRKTLTGKGAEAASFSTILSKTEFVACGLELLETPERERLDDLILEWRREAPQGQSAPSPFAARMREEIPLDETRLRPRIGGEISLTYGIAEGGGTLRSGSFMATFDDPVRKFSAAIGFSHTRADGGFVQPPLIYAPAPLVDR